MLEGPDSFKQQIKAINRNWKLVIILGTFLLFLRSILFYFDAIQTWEPDMITELGVNRQFDDANQDVPLTDLFFKDILSLGLFPIVGSFLIFIVAYFGQIYQTGKPVDDLFRIYEITKVKQFTGKIDFSDTLSIKIEWTKKGYFNLKLKEQIVSLAKPSELYWKILYLSYKWN